MEVLGYGICDACGRAETVATLTVTGGRCQQCGLATVPERKIRLGGADLPVKRVPRVVRKGFRTRNELKRKSVLEKAKRRAMKRLRDQYPEEYLGFLADERAKLGMDPYPLQWAIKTSDQAPT
jgi:hypothetical protein